MLKTLKFPFAEKFESSLDKAQGRAVSVGYAESDIRDIMKTLRRKKNRGNCVDTNVLISGMFFCGFSRKNLSSIVNEKITVYATSEIINEYEEIVQEVNG